MIDFVITSDAGRIGEMWWFNSDQRVFTPTWGGDHIFPGVLCRQWGTFGFGRRVKIHLQSVEDQN